MILHSFPSEYPYTWGFFLTAKNIICYDIVRDLNFKHLDIMEYFVMQQSKCK